MCATRFVAVANALAVVTLFEITTQASSWITNRVAKPHGRADPLDLGDPKNLTDADAIGTGADVTPKPKRAEKMTMSDIKKLIAADLSRIPLPTLNYRLCIATMHKIGIS